MPPPGTVTTRSGTGHGHWPVLDGSARSPSRERVRQRTIDPSARLTARETQIAQLARDGLSNPAIAAQLFMSPRTVEYHLHKVFTKLGISSSNQLRGVLVNRDATGWS